MQRGSNVPRSEWLGRMIAWLDSPALTAAWRAYLLALVILAGVMGVRAGIALVFDDLGPTFILFLLPVIAVSFLAGVRPGLFATVVSGVCGYFVFLEPAFTLNRDRQDLVLVAVFAAEGVLISVAGGRLRTLVARLIDRDDQLAASEARLRVAQQAARIGTYEWDPATGKSLWSDNAEVIMGMPPGTFKGTYEDSLRTTLPEDRAVVEEAALQLMRDGSNQMETRVVREDGEQRWVRSTGTIIRNEIGGIDRVVGVMMDVTEQLRSSEISVFMADATAELGISLDYRTNLAGVARVAVPRFSDACVVVLVENGLFPADIVATAHRDPGRTRLVDELKAVLDETPDQPGVVARSIRSGTPLFAPAITSEFLEEASLSSRHHEVLERLQPSSLICIPLTARGTTLGALIFLNEGNRIFDQSDYRLARELGHRAALAIENALLLEQSFEREAGISRANEALQLLADSGVTLSRRLDISETMTSLAELVVPRFADVCSISIDVNGKVERAALACANSTLEHAMESFNESPAADRGLFEAAASTLNSGRPIYFPQISDEMLDKLVVTPDHAIAMAALAPRSFIAMPMTARGQTIGVMGFIRTKSSPPFDREDLSLAGQLGRRAAISADNARLYLEATRANDAKDEFLGMMSHELRTPITVIHGGARVLRSRAHNLDDETRAGLLKDIERESDRLARMLENLLALARAELDREVVLEPVLLQRLLPRLVESQGPSTGRDVSWTSEGEPPAVAAEPGYIEHIVRNLVGNAVKYSPPDAPIEVVLSGREGGASIKVLDRGFGIAGDEANRIFERFYRSDRTSRLAGGAGLGLAVCKRLVEAMSGEIWATPREGGGLEVGFSLPAYREEHVEV